jgi:hypothetical protein
MAKHTPGPWEAYHVNSAGWSVRMANPRDGYSSPDPVCSMAWWQFDIPGIIDNQISGANAKLIAAAPEMLAAIQGAMRIVSLWNGREVPEGHEHYEEMKALHMMQQAFIEAIAKAVE